METVSSRAGSAGSSIAAACGCPSRLVPGARRPDYLALACKAINEALRISKKWAKKDPHVYGPHSHQYYRDTVQMEKEQQQREAALRRVYGPLKPGQPAFVSTLWQDRYHHPTPEARRIFLKWLHEQYTNRPPR